MIQQRDKTIFFSTLGADSTKDSRGYKDYKDYKEVPCKDKSYNSDFSLLELENRELKMKIRRLEKELADKVSKYIIFDFRKLQMLYFNAKNYLSSFIIVIVIHKKKTYIWLLSYIIVFARTTVVKDTYILQKKRSTYGCTLVKTGDTACHLN